MHIYNHHFMAARSCHGELRTRQCEEYTLLRIVYTTTLSAHYLYYGQTDDIARANQYLRLCPGLPLQINCRNAQIGDNTEHARSSVRNVPNK